MGTKQNKQREVLFEYGNKIVRETTKVRHSKAFLDLFYIIRLNLCNLILG